MSRMGFEPMILAFERAKTVHAVEHVVTVIGHGRNYEYIKEVLIFMLCIK
jgi:hypothetical protein